MFLFNIVLVVLVILAELILLIGFIAGKGKNKLPLFIGPLIFVLSACFLLYEVRQVTYDVEVELGDELPLEPGEYLSGIPFVVQNSTLDTEAVNLSKVGEYHLGIRHFIQTFEVRVTVKDTTPPELLLVEGPVYVEKDKQYDVSNLVQRTYDLSGPVSVAYEQAYQFDTCGEKTVSVVATDLNGNITRERFTLVVDTAPTLENIKEYYLAIGESADFAKYITARDDVDGNLTAQIIMDESEVDCYEKGEYIVYYSVTDQYGLTAEAETSVWVLPPYELQGMIKNHQINRNDEEIVGALNLYDGGVYAGKTIDEIGEYIRPGIVCLFYPKANGSWSRGSGFIISIDEEDIIICTNYHVISSGDNPEVHFFNNKTAPGKVAAKGRLICSEDDIAFVRVKRKDVDDETMKKLNTIHINKGYYDSLGKNEGIELLLQSMDQNGKIWFDEDGILVDKSMTYPDKRIAEKYGQLTQISIALKPGVSGSAIVDKEGNLICMAVANYNYGKKRTDYGIRLNKILEMYFDTFKKQAYYE